MHVKHLVLFGVFICKEKIHALLFSSINTLVNGILSIMRGSSFFFFEKLKLTLISTLKYYRIERTIMSDKKTRSQKDSSMTRLNVPTTTTDRNNHPPSLAAASSFLSPSESMMTTKPRTTIADLATRINLEGITFVCLDLPFQSIPILFGSLRGINDYIQTFTDSSLCLNWIRSSSSSIFFISSSSDRDFIAAVHALTTVEAIFILNSEAQVNKNDFPKLAGVFSQHEEFFMVLEDTLTWFEQSKLEVFAFENDNIFLWSQLWKEEVSKSANEII
jgi:hypothetical protein